MTDVQLTVPKPADQTMSEKSHEITSCISNRPLIWLGMEDPYGDKCHEPCCECPCPYCAFCTNNTSGHRSICNGSCCGCWSSSNKDWACCECPCPAACLGMIICYPILCPISFCFPNQIRIGPYFFSHEIGPCNGCGGGKYNRSEWYSKNGVDNCCTCCSCHGCYTQH